MGLNLLLEMFTIVAFLTSYLIQTTDSAETLITYPRHLYSRWRGVGCSLVSVCPRSKRKTA